MHRLFQHTQYTLMLTIQVARTSNMSRVIMNRQGGCVILMGNLNIASYMEDSNQNICEY
jgi:hypothetical protein